MLRDIDLKEISDGRLYRANDMVKVGCNDCKGCSACCHDMEGLFLDPLDASRLSNGLNRSFDSFLDNELVLDHCDGLILPKMHMDAERNACHFLNEEGRCSVHAHRPGICRLFPLGRYYEDGDFSYFLQTNECPAQNRYKLRVSQWVDTPDPEKYHDYILRWHNFTRAVGEKTSILTAESARQVLLYILKVFYQTPFRGHDFYAEFDSRMSKAEAALAPLLNA